MKAMFQRRRRSSKSTSACSSSISTNHTASPFPTNKTSKQEPARTHPPSSVIIGASNRSKEMDHSESTAKTTDLSASFHSLTPSLASENNSPTLTSPIFRKRSISFVPPSPLLLPSIVTLPSSADVFTSEEGAAHRRADHHQGGETPTVLRLEQQIQTLLHDIRQSLAQKTKQLLDIQKDLSHHWQRALVRQESQQTTGVRLSLRKIHCIQQSEQSLLLSIQALTDQHVEASRLARKIRNAARADDVHEPWVIELLATLNQQLCNLQEDYDKANRTDELPGQQNTCNAISFGEREEAMLMQELHGRSAAISSASSSTASL